MIIKKLVTAGVLITEAEFPMEALAGIDPTIMPTAIATMVDTGITLTKVAYKVATGEMSVNEGLEYIKDRAIADIGIVVETALKLKIEAVGAAIGGTVGALVGRVSGKYIAPKVTQGIQKLTQVATPIIKNVVQKTVEVAQKTGTAIKEGAKKLWNWLTK